MIFAVQTGEFQGKPWFRYFQTLTAARRLAKRLGAEVVRIEQ